MPSRNTSSAGSSKGPRSPSPDASSPSAAASPSSSLRRPFRNSVIAHPHEYKGAKILPPKTPTSAELTASDSADQLLQLYSPILNSSITQEGPLDGEGHGASGSAGPSHLQGVVLAEGINLVPQRSAPAPPVAARSAGASSSSANGFAGNTHASPPAAYSTKTAAPQRSSYIAGSYRNLAPVLSTPSSSQSSSKTGLPAQSPGLPYAPSGNSSAPASGPASGTTYPQRPERSQTADSEAFSSLSSLSQRGYQQQQQQGGSGLSGGMHSLSLTSPSSSNNSSHEAGAGGATSPPPSQTPTSISRAKSEGPNGRNTLKSVFGGFVNSMSGRWPKLDRKLSA